MRVHSPTPTPYAPRSGTAGYPRIIRTGSPTHPMGAYGVGPRRSGVQAREMLGEAA